MRLENWFITNPDTSQQEVLKVPINQNLIVKGAAGSGKTNMAIYRANQAGDNSFVIVVYTVALKKMVRYGLTELGLDKDRVVHEWSWIHRGIEISGNLYFHDSKLIILQESDNNIRYFMAVGGCSTYNDTWEKRYNTSDYDTAIQTGKYLNYKVAKRENPLEVSIDFDEWVSDFLYRTFYRRERLFREIQVLDYNFLPQQDKFVPSGFLFKEKGVVNYLIVDEGQDFSISDYKSNFISKAEKAITIFGDTNQQLYKNRGTNVEEIVKYFNYPLKKLDFNYRVPKTVAKVAQTIPQPHLDLLSNNRKNNGNSDFPNFPKPIIKKCNSEDEEIQYIVNRIQTEGLDDVAILIWENNDVKKVYEILASKGIGTQVRYTVSSNTISGFTKVDTLDFTNHDLPCLLSFHSAKGTEFDNIFIPFANDDNRTDRNAFYVGCTRSSSRLFITYSRKLTSFLKDVNSNDIIYQ